MVVVRPRLWTCIWSFSCVTSGIANIRRLGDAFCFFGICLCKLGLLLGHQAVHYHGFLVHLGLWQTHLHRFEHTSHDGNCVSLRSSKMIIFQKLFPYPRDLCPPPWLFPQSIRGRYLSLNSYPPLSLFRISRVTFIVILDLHYLASAPINGIHENDQYWAWRSFACC